MSLYDFIDKDDIFILGNIGLVSIDGNYIETGLELMQYIQSVQPQNAAGFVGEAVYHFTKQEYEKGIEVLEESGALEAEEGSDFALALHVSLLHAAGREDDANTLTEAYLEEGMVTQPKALEALETTVKIVESEIGQPIEA